MLFNLVLVMKLYLYVFMCLADAEEILPSTLTVSFLLFSVVEVEFLWVRVKHILLCVFYYCILYDCVF